MLMVQRKEVAAYVTLWNQIIVLHIKDKYFQSTKIRVRYLSLAKLKPWTHLEDNMNWW